MRYISPKQDKMFQTSYEVIMRGNTRKCCNVCGYSIHTGVVWIIQMEEYLCSFCIDWVMKTMRGELGRKVRYGT
jgi:hypothetical protein